MESQVSLSQVPKQKPGKSDQVVCTPPEFLAALKFKVAVPEFGYDLAADADNAVASSYYTEEDDALIQSWAEDIPTRSWAFCNPPFGDIEPWVRKACLESIEKGANVAMLLPASTGSNWWKAYVHNKCYVLLLNGRLTFVGHKTPYPKDLVVLLYTPMGLRGYDVWNWRI